MPTKINKPTLYVLGNTLVEEDKTAPDLIPRIEKEFPDLNIVHLDPTESLPDLPIHPVFLDTVLGITDVTVFNSLEAFTPPPRYSAHDYDLYTELTLLKKINKIEGFTIIGVPNEPQMTQLLGAIRLLIQRNLFL